MSWFLRTQSLPNGQGQLSRCSVSSSSARYYPNKRLAGARQVEIDMEALIRVAVDAGAAIMAVYDGPEARAHFASLVFFCLTELLFSPPSHDDSTRES